jgi:hypothetical protein
MDVTRKRDSKHISNNSPSDKRRKLRNLSSELDGDYWKQKSTRRKRTTRRAEPATSTTAPPAATPAVQQHFGVVVRRPTFDVGLPVVFGGNQLGPTAPLQADEIEEPYSPTYAGFAPRRLIAAAPAPPVNHLQLSRTNTDYTWNFVPSWQALTVGARILSRVLTFPLAVARYLVDVAPETRQRARQIEAAERERLRQLQIEAEANQQAEAEANQQTEAEANQQNEDVDNFNPNVEVNASPFITPLRRLPEPRNTITAGMSTSAGAPAGGSAGGPAGTPAGSPAGPSPSADATVIAYLKRLERRMDEKFAAMEMQLAKDAPVDDAGAREKALAAELLAMETKTAAIAKERELIRTGDWTGPTVPLSPTSIFVAPSPAVVQPSPLRPPQPRFSPNDLPQILFGDDLEEWISEMDHIVTSFGESVVCPHVLPRCFAQGDPIRDWYLTQPAATHIFVTAGNGCWDRFKTLLRSRFRPDLGVLQFEADTYRRLPNESWTAFGIRKYRLLKRAYAGSDDSNIILKIKADMDTEVVRYCKEKSNIDLFVGELMDFDRTSPATSRSGNPNYGTGSNYASASRNPNYGTGSNYASASRNPSYGTPSGTPMDRGNSRTPARTYPPERPSYDPPRPVAGREKGKAPVRDDRKNSVQNRINPETGKPCRSYLNFQMKPVFIKRACSLCEKNGRPNQMHFTFECIDSSAKTLAIEVGDDDDALADTLYRTDSGHLTSYNFQHGATHAAAIYHEEDDDYEMDLDPGNGQGGW